MKILLRAVLLVCVFYCVSCYIYPMSMCIDGDKFVVDFPGLNYFISPRVKSCEPVIKEKKKPPETLEEHLREYSEYVIAKFPLSFKELYLLVLSLGKVIIDKFFSLFRHIRRYIPYLKEVKILSHGYLFRTYLMSGVVFFTIIFLCLIRKMVFYYRAHLWRHYVVFVRTRKIKMKEFESVMKVL